MQLCCLSFGRARICDSECHLVKYERGGSQPASREMQLSLVSLVLELLGTTNWWFPGFCGIINPLTVVTILTSSHIIFDVNQMKQEQSATHHCLLLGMTTCDLMCHGV